MAHWCHLASCCTCEELMQAGVRPKLLSPGGACLCLVCSAPGWHLHKVCKALLAWIDWCVSTEIKFTGSSWSACRTVLPLLPPRVCCNEKYIVRSSFLNSQFNSVYPSKLIGLPDFSSHSVMHTFWNAIRLLMNVFFLAELLLWALWCSYLSNPCIFCGGELHDSPNDTHALTF